MGIAEHFKRAAGAGGPKESKRYGVDVATVTNITDPDNLNRVKCQRITGEDDIGETDWMFVSTPFAGNAYGIFFMPNVGDLVLITYIDGNVHNPVVIGSVWSKEDPVAPYAVEGGKNETFSIKLPSGAEILISETGGSEKISVTTKAGHSLLLDDGGNMLKLSDADGSNFISMDLGGGEMSLTAASKITLKAGGETVELDGNGASITVDGSNSVKITGAQITGEATGSLGLSGNSEAKLESSGVTTISGSMVKIN